MHLLVEREARPPFLEFGKERAHGVREVKKMVAVVPLYFFQGRRGGSLHFGVRYGILVENLPPLVDVEIDLFIAPATEQMTDEVPVGRIAEFLSHGHFLLGDSTQVGFSGVLNGRFVRGIGLDVHFPGTVSAPCPTSDLDEQLEGPLGGPEVLHSQRKVGIDHAD